MTTYDDLIERQEAAIANMMQDREAAEVVTYDDLIEMQDRAIEAACREAAKAA